MKFWRAGKWREWWNRFYFPCHDPKRLQCRYACSPRRIANWLPEHASLPSSTHDAFLTTTGPLDQTADLSIVVLHRFSMREIREGHLGLSCHFTRHRLVVTPYSVRERRPWYRKDAVGPGMEMLDFVARLLRRKPRDSRDTYRKRTDSAGTYASMTG